MAPIPSSRNSSAVMLKRDAFTSIIRYKKLGRGPVASDSDQAFARRSRRDHFHVVELQRVARNKAGELHQAGITFGFFVRHRVRAHVIPAGIPVEVPVAALASTTTRDSRRLARDTLRQARMGFPSFSRHSNLQGSEHSIGRFLA